MNIQPTSYTKNHLLNNNGSNVHLSQDELSIKKRREDLSRRPSYRKIFNDLTGLSGPLSDGALAPLPIGGGNGASAGQASVPALDISHLAPPPSATTNPAVLAATAPQNRHSPQLHRPPTASPSPIQGLDLLNVSTGALPHVIVNQQQQDAAASLSGQAPLASSQSPVSVVDLQTTTTSSSSTPTQLQQLQHSNHNQQQHQLHQQQTHHLTPPTNHLQAPSAQANQHHLQQAPPHHLHHHHQHHPHQQHHPQHHPQHHQQQHQQPPPQQRHHQHHQQQPPQHHIQQQHQLTHIHQLQTATSPPITGNGTGSNGVVVVGEEANKKREMRLQKNREAAKECRRKKKEYIKCLENRVAVLENQNKALIDELKTLKDLYCKTTTE